VEAGFGAAIMPPYGALVPGEGNSVVRPLRDPVVRSEIALIHDRFRSPSAAAAAFIEVARDVVAGRSRPLRVT